MEEMASEVEDIVKQLNNLSLEDENDSSEEIIKILQKITNSDTSTLDNYDLVEVFLKLLQQQEKQIENTSSSSSLKISILKEIQKEIIKCIAEITKTEAQRKKFTNLNVIKLLIDIIKINLQNYLNTNKFDIELLIQVCRALGNLCYSNDDARNLIVNINGDEYLINLLGLDIRCDRKNNKNLKQTEKNVTEAGDGDNGDGDGAAAVTASSSSSSTSQLTNELQFIKVRGGLISNYLLGEENLAKRAMNYKIMDKLQTIVNQCCINEKEIENNEDLLLNTLPPLSILTENVADINFDINLNKQLAQILAVSKNPDLAEMCLELLHYQAENDDVKLLLAKEGLCETIYRLLEKYKTLASSNGARALMKLACDLIVLILTGDESMHYLYSTSLLKNMEDWLDSNDIDLLTTGVLALGNFARTDSHCIYMVENKIMDKLLDILSKNNGVDDNMRLQHALLSALRNLVIPKPNKGAVIQAGLVQTILPMLEIHQPPVVFKLLGTLRMTVDGQESLALELLQNKTLIEQLVKWSKSSDFACVTGESLRLMAWLIKHAYHTTRDKPSTLSSSTTTDDGATGDAAEVASSLPSNTTSTTHHKIDETSLKAFVMTDGAVESMINMLTSQHVVMQNEALIALSIISSIFLSKNNLSSISLSDNINLIDLYIKYELGKKLAEFIKRSSDNMTKEIVENLQTFTTILRQSDKLNNHLEENNVNELLKSIPILTEYCTL